MKAITKLATVALLFFASCEKAPINQGNYKNSACLNEGCECEEGYTGNTCNELLIPSSISIAEITLQSLPAFNNGESWDRFEGKPDIYFMVKQQHSEVYIHDEVMNDVDVNKVLHYNELNIKINDVMAEYSLRLLDHDEDSKSSEIIEDIHFKAYDKKVGFPEFIVIKEGEVEAKLRLAYEF